MKTEQDPDAISLFLKAALQNREKRCYGTLGFVDISALPLLALAGFGGINSNLLGVVAAQSSQNSKANRFSTD